MRWRRLLAHPARCLRESPWDTLRAMLAGLAWMRSGGCAGHMRHRDAIHRNAANSAIQTCSGIDVQTAVACPKILSPRPAYGNGSLPKFSANSWRGSLPKFSTLYHFGSLRNFD